MGAAALFQDEAQQLMFLHAIHPACLAAQQRGQDTLEPQCCKAAVVERIVELIENLSDDSPPSTVLANSLIAVGILSTMKPVLEPELETHLLRAALHAIFTLGTQVQALHKSPQTQPGSTTSWSTPTSGSSRVCQERARAIRSSTALLRSTITLPEFDNSAEFARMGHHVAQLAVFIGYPAKDISQQAREGVYWLYQLLLHQRGLTIHEAEDLWCWDWHQDSRLLGYRNTARVGEVFRKFFSEEQRRSFLRTALLAIHDPLLRVCQAGLLLTYFLLGEAQQLVGDKPTSARAAIGRGASPAKRLRHQAWPGPIGSEQGLRRDMDAMLKSSLTATSSTSWSSAPSSKTHQSLGSQSPSCLLFQG
ncbi:unnamed protein product [Caretta caretta]